MRVETGDLQGVVDAGSNSADTAGNRIKATTKEQFFARYGQWSAQAKAAYDSDGTAELAAMVARANDDFGPAEPAPFAANASPAYLYRFSYVHEALKANMPLLTLVREWAQKKGVTPVQLALGWLLAQKPWIVPIPGTTNPRHLEENLGAVNVTFTPAELLEIRGSLSKIALVGVRTPDSALKDQ